MQERLSLAVEASGLGTFYCPMPLGPVEWNAKCKEHFWLPPEAEVDLDLFYSRLHPDDREPTRRAVEATVNEQKPYDVEYRTVSPQGEIRWIRAIGRSFVDEAGQPVRFDGVTLDITKAKETERTLAEQRRTLERLTERLRFLDELAETKRQLTDPQSVMELVTRRLGEHLQVSRCAYATVDLKSGAFHVPGDYTDGCVSIVGTHRLETFGGAIQHLQSGRALIWNDLRAQIVDPAEVAAFEQIEIAAMIAMPLLKAGELVAAIAVHQRTPRAWTDDEVQLLAEVAERTWASIERIKAYRLVESQREQLLAAEREARAAAERAGRIKDEFLATLSHELRTPLSAIMGWAQILGARNTDPEITQGIEVIARNARAQTQIIEDLLDMNRIITGKIRLDVRTVDVRAVIDAAAETVRPAADAKEITFEIDLCESCIVRGDSGRLQQVFWNLLSNAVKFTPRAGLVRVDAERRGDYLEVRVSDNGEGIAPEFAEHVFERFQQADASSTRRHGGLGLGLAIVRQLVELHGGNVRAASEGLGRGATFTVSLPVSHTFSESPPRASASVADAPGLPAAQGRPLEGTRVLVVDDEPDAREVTRRLLAGFGAMVRTASSAAEAFTELPGFRPEVLVCDIGMPGEDGLALIRRIRSLPASSGGETPAVALTAYARTEDRVASLNAGFQMHAAKPVNAAELITIVRSLARLGERRLPSAIGGGM